MTGDPGGRVPLTAVGGFLDVDRVYHGVETEPHLPQRALSASRSDAGSSPHASRVRACVERSWNCQFPTLLREEGARYAVDAVVPARRGGFHRVRRAIRRLVDERVPAKKTATRKTAAQKITAKKRAQKA